MLSIRTIWRIAASAVAVMALAAAFAEPIRSSLGAHGKEELVQQEYTAADYVQDGLVALLDGIENSGWGEHDGEATKWRDLVTFAQSKDLSGKGQFTEDSCVFTSRAVNLFYTAQMRDAVGSSEFTAEVVFKPSIYNYGIFIWGSPQGFNFLVLSDYAVRFLSGGTKVAQTTARYAYDFHSYSITRSGLNAKAFTDGMQLGGEVECTAIGMPSDGLDIMISEVNCIRIYARPLTSDEIRHNNKVDRARFGL